MIFLQFWFWVEQIDMARAAIHKEKNDRFGSGMKMRLFCGQGIATFFILSIARFSSQQTVCIEHTRQGQAGETCAGAKDQLTACHHDDHNLLLGTLLSQES